MITLETNYAKKIGLPGFCSHQFSVSLKTELTDLAQVPQESARLYAQLQQSVDHSIQQIGYLPGTNSNGNGHPNGNGHSAPAPDKDKWSCSVKQRNLITKIITEHTLDRTVVDRLAQDRFGKPAQALNKLEASGLIDELLEQTGQGEAPTDQPGQKAGAR